LTLIVLNTTVFGQNFEWAGTFGGSGEDVVRDLYVDASGNSYATGYFTDIADFDISEAQFNAAADSFYDVFIQKTNSLGEFQWVKTIGGTPFEYGVGICSDDDGNVYVTGVFEETIDFNPGAGVFEMTSSGGLDIFILKLDSQGEFIWAKSIGGSEYEESTEIEIDSEGNVLLLGYFYSQVDFDPSGAEYSLTPEGFSDSFIMKLDSNGEFLFAKSFGGNDLDLAMDMAVSNDGNILITGFFQGTSDFDPDPMTENFRSSSTSGSSGYVLSLNSEGEFMNVFHTLGGDTNCRGIAVDDDGNSYATGTYNSTVDFDADPDNGDINTYTSDLNFNGFVMRVNQDGTFGWVNPIDCDSPLFSYSLVVSSYDNLFISGYFAGTADFDGDANSEFELTQFTENASEAFLLELTNAGVFVSAYQYGGANFLDTHAIGIDGADNVYLAAHFEGEADINPLPDTNSSASSSGFRDNYLIKLSPDIFNIGEAITGINEKVYCYPNPTSNAIKVRTDSSLANRPYKIYSPGGKLIKSGIVNLNNQIELNNISSGIYFLSVDELGYFRIIKE